MSKMDRIKGWRIPVLTGLGLLFALAVASVTGKMSWGHIVHVGRLVGEPDAGILPVAVDGMMLAGAVMGAVDRLRGMKVRGWAVTSMWLGSALTLTFNVASAWERGIVAMLVAAVPAATMLVTVEVIFHPSRRVIEVIRGRRWWSRKRADVPAEAVAIVPEPTSDPAPVAPAQPEPAPAVKPTRKPRASTPGAPRGANTRPRTRKVAEDEVPPTTTPDGPTVRPRPLAIEAQSVRVVDPPADLGAALNAAFSNAG